MPTICRLIGLSPDNATNLLASPDSLSNRVRSASTHSDVYRYWHAIEYLLAQNRPGSAAARWLTLGAAVSPATAGIPAARVLSAGEVQELNADIRDIQPDDLIAHYDAAALDAAQIYPATWQAWEEDFDPLGQVLEHYFFLQQFTAQRAEAGDAALLYFDVLAEGTV
jgi:uncharacterized protein DUF1877